MNDQRALPHGLEHWPAEIWSDYLFAYVRLVTLRVENKTHLLFASVELLPKEISPLPAYQVPRGKFPHGVTAMSSTVALNLDAAIRWYENSLLGTITIPGTAGPACVQTVRLAPEPRLGSLVVAKTPTVPLAWNSEPRMHRMVPMEDLPNAVRLMLTAKSEGSGLRSWLVEQCFIDLVAYPDCAGGLVLLAPNPVVREFSHYPLRRLSDGREVLGLRLVPRIGCVLDTIKARLSEIRPDGVSFMQEIALDPWGEAEVVLPQDVDNTALELSCTERGLLSALPHTRFIRSLDFRTTLIQNTLSIEVPARSSARSNTRYSVPITDSRLTTESHIGQAVENSAVHRLALLLGSRSNPSGTPVEEVVFRNDRELAVLFVRNIVSHALSDVLFVDRYFSFDDVREFALSVWSGSCRIRVLTSALAKWTKPLGHFTTEKLHGDLMLTDMLAINEVRERNGLFRIDVQVMKELGCHDRFLVADDVVWHFGDSFRTLGAGAVSMASKVKDLSLLLPVLHEVSAAAEPFKDYWARVRPGDSTA